MLLPKYRTCVWWLVVLLLWGSPSRAGVRIKDITDLQGSRANQLRGLGLVVGLNNTGSKSLFTQNLAVSMLSRLRADAKVITDLKSDPVIQSGNISAVMVIAELGPFSRCGSRLDVVVSALDDAKSLQGGTLLFTPLSGADDVVYVVAQGPLSVGGFTFGGQAASAQQNHPTVGRIPGGGIVEQEARGEIVCNGQLRLLLRSPDYVTAQAIAKAINAKFVTTALTLDAGTVQVAVPRDRLPNVVNFVAEIGLLEVTPDAPARVVINERTGTIVAGEQVKIARVAIAHGNLRIVTAETPQVSQPEPLCQGRTVVVPRTQLGVSEQKGKLEVVEPSVTVADLARALNALGATPRDLITIFQALKDAGALHAELVIM